MMKVVFSERYLSHETDTPEIPERLLRIRNFLEGKAEFCEPREIEERELLLVHATEHVERLKALSKSEGGRWGDNQFHKNTFEIAKLACGGALRAAEEEGFGLVRPPGHHAGTDSFSGFCYLNNLAFAVRKMQRAGKASRALIVDFDVHHGNGTQEIFEGDESVFYLSFHQDPRTIFPYSSGFESENGPRVRNVPLAPGTGDEAYLKTFRRTLSESAKSFEPDFVAVSAGFDTYAEDVCCGNALKIKNFETYSEIGKEIARLRVPVFSVLEGGYFLDALGKCVWNYLEGLRKTER